MVRSSVDSRRRYEKNRSARTALLIDHVRIFASVVCLTRHYWEHSLELFWLFSPKRKKRTLLIPWWLGYGASGKDSIPGKATLRFEVELLDIR